MQDNGYTSWNGTDSSMSTCNAYVTYSRITVSTTSYCRNVHDVSTRYLDDWPETGDPPPPWLPPMTVEYKRKRWLPPRCMLKALVPRRDFPQAYANE